MSEELSIADLKADMDDQLPDDTDEQSGGEWVKDLVEMLDQRGYLDPLIQHSLGVGPAEAGEGSAPVETDGGPEAAAAGADLTAEDVAQFGKMVIDQVGDVPMSKVVQYAEGNPETVNRLIEQATQGP